MFYPFPTSLGLDEVRQAIFSANTRLGRVCFIEADRGDHVIFNYVLAFNDTFPQPDLEDEAVNREYAILRECRGLVFDKAYGVVLSRRYHKFFNINEKSFTQSHLIDWTQPHVVLEKLDGSMIAPYPHAGRPGGVAWGTKMGATDVSLPVEDFVEKNPQYRTLFFELYERGFTPLFEWCSRKQKIVIDHKVDRLVLTGVRSIHSGEYASHAALLAFGLTYGVEVVKALPGTAENIEQFMADAYDVEGEEGYIIRFHNGHMLKIKGRWYCQIHRTKDNLTREKDVWKMILDDNLDDVKPFMDPDDRARVDAYLAEFESRIAERGAFLRLHVDVARAVGNDKKAFAASLKDVDPMERGLLFSIWDGNEPADCIRELLKKNYSTGTKIENVRRMLNGLRWDDYRDHNVILDA